MSRSSFGKRDRDRAKKAKAQAKRERRQAPGEPLDGADDEAAVAAPDDGLSTADLLQKIEDVHRLHAAGGISDDDFQETKAELLGRLSVD